MNFKELQALTPAQRGIFQTVYTRLGEVAQAAPAPLRTLLLHTMPRAPRPAAPLAHWDDYQRRACQHCDTFAGFITALQRLRNAVETNASQRVH